MDLYNLPKLIEQGVYDVMMWILFFPMTLLRMIAAPRRTLAYVRGQSGLPDDEAFSDAMRPAVFLVIAIIIGSWLDPSDAAERAAMMKTDIGKFAYGSWASGIVFETTVLCVTPLTGALLLDLMTPGKVTRESLRQPFQQQCYIGAPSILAVNAAFGLHEVIGMAASVAIGSAACLWVIMAEYIYFRDNGLAPAKAAGLALVTLAAGALLVVTLFVMLLGIKA